MSAFYRSILKFEVQSIELKLSENALQYDFGSNELKKEIMLITDMFPVPMEILDNIKKYLFAENVKQSYTAFSILEQYLWRSSVLLAKKFDNQSMCLKFVTLVLNTQSKVLKNQVLKVILICHFLLKNVKDKNDDHHIFEVIFTF